jgi:putative DNA primase/helicase
MNSPKATTRKKGEELYDWSLKSEATKYVENTLSSAAVLPEIKDSLNQFDANPWILGMKNGVLDLKTGKFRDARPDDYLTKQAGVEYVKDAKCPKWEKFLLDIFDGDEDLVLWLQKLVGYCLTGDTSEHFFNIFHGKGRNGKGVFFTVLGWMLGDYMGVANFSTFDASNRSEMTNDLASLKGARILLISETEKDKYLAEAKLKQVTGEDPIKCRFLNKEFFTYYPEFKIMMAFNYKPRIRGTDEGIWQRINLIPCTKRYLNPDRQDDAKQIAKLKAAKKPVPLMNKRLRSQLHGELSGILNWALQGLALYQADGLGFAPAVEEATKKYRKDSDTLGLWLEECTALDVNAKVYKKRLYESYVEWTEANGMHAVKSSTFFEDLTERLVEEDEGVEYKRLTGGAYGFTGIKLVGSDADDTPAEPKKRRSAYV